MPFNVKNTRLPSGSLVRLKENTWLSPITPDGRRDPAREGRTQPAGSVLVVLEHTHPAYIRLHVPDGGPMLLDLGGRVPIHGWAYEFELIATPEGCPVLSWGWPRA